jgi:hypothetical protein
MWFDVIRHLLPRKCFCLRDNHTLSAAFLESQSHRNYSLPFHRCSCSAYVQSRRTKLDPPVAPAIRTRSLGLNAWSISSTMRLPSIHNYLGLCVNGGKLQSSHRHLNITDDGLKDWHFLLNLPLDEGGEGCSELGRPQFSVTVILPAPAIGPSNYKAIRLHTSRDKLQPG